jgi:hypothetical protein
MQVEALVQNISIAQKAPFSAATAQNTSQRNNHYVLSDFASFARKSSLFASWLILQKDFVSNSNRWEHENTRRD